MISAEEIRETFYNLMVDVAVHHKYNFTDPQTISKIIIETIRTICQLATPHGFPTIRNQWVNSNNVCLEFNETFQVLDRIRLIIDPLIKTQAINQLTTHILQKPIFMTIIQDVIKFGRESTQDLTPKVTIESIRETFYNTIVDEVLMDETQTIKREHLEDQDAFIFFALSCLAILSSISHSINLKGIKLVNGACVTMSNCPKEYLPLFQNLLLIRNQYKLCQFTDPQLALIRLCAINDPDREIPEHLKSYQTSDLMLFVANVTNLAINISAIGHFKEILNSVITYCLDALPK